MIASAGAAAAAAAAARLRAIHEEEERLTEYSPQDLAQGWEFKILRANTAAFRDSAVKRTKWQGLIRNACIALGNAPITPGTAFHREVENTLKQLCQSDDSVISESARWALLRIQ